jgi:hypothetical protein
MILTVNCVPLVDQDNEMTFYLKTAYQKHPDFKRNDFGKKEWRTFQKICPFPSKTCL